MGVPSGPLSKGFPKSLGSLWGMAVTGRETRPSQDSLMEAPGCLTGVRGEECGSSQRVFKQLPTQREAGACSRRGPEGLVGT